MTKPQIEVIKSIVRRWCWSGEEKERLVAATFESGAIVSEVARAAGIYVSKLFRWRNVLCQIPGFGSSMF
jgi:transposase